MRLLKSAFGGSFLLMIMLTACTKAKFDKEVKGEALANFRLASPANDMSLILNPATPTEDVVIKWGASTPGISTKPEYTWVAALKTGGSLEEPMLEIPADSAGLATQLRLSMKQLDDALAAKGIAAGDKVDLIWSVVANNGTTTLRAQDVFNLSITRMKDGASAFYVLAPVSSLDVQSINPGSTSTNFTFKWTKSTATPGSPDIKYNVLFALRTVDALGNEEPINWSLPLFSVQSDNLGADTLATVTHKQLSDLLTANGFANPAQPVTLTWTVEATTGNWKQVSDFANNLSIVREVKLYLVGGSSPIGWNPPQALRLIEDPRFPGTFFIYSYLTSGGGGIKFLTENTDWNTPTQKIYGNQGGDGSGGNLESPGGNIQVATDGVYRVTVDLTSNKYYLQTAVSNGIGGMGMIGGFQGWSQPALKMSYISTNKFIYVTNMSTNDEFKFHDGNDWDNSANNKHRWYAVDNGSGGKMIIDPGSGYDNFKWTGATGRVRAIWDGSNSTDLQYNLTSAAQMRVVGNGINQSGVNDWDPGSSPQMTYNGNGVWSINITLKANMEIKFLAGDAWGAFDYEDNSGGNQTLGTVMPIRWDGNNNFKTPAVAGTYTITLDEHKQTVKIE